MKETYERTNLEIDEFDAADVIATSATHPTNADQFDDYEGRGFPFD